MFKTKPVYHFSLPVLNFSLFTDVFHPFQCCGFCRLASIKQKHLDFSPDQNESFKNANNFQPRGGLRWRQPLNLSHLKYEDKQKQTSPERNPIAFLFAEMHLALQHSALHFHQIKWKRNRFLKAYGHPPTFHRAEQENQLRNYDSLVMLGEMEKLNSHTNSK